MPEAVRLAGRPHAAQGGRRTWLVALEDSALLQDNSFIAGIEPSKLWIASHVALGHRDSSRPAELL